MVASYSSCNINLTWLFSCLLLSATLSAHVEKLKSASTSSTSLKLQTTPSDLPNATSTIQIRLMAVGTGGEEDHHYQGGYYSYTVKNLQPNTWYAVELKSIVHNGSSEMSNVDTTLVHTKTETGATSDGSEGPVNPVTILAAWNDKSIHAAWRLDDPDTFPKVVGEMVVICGNVNRTDTIALSQRDPNGTTRVNLTDTESRILQDGNDTHKWVDIEVSYGACKAFCLTYWVYVSNIPFLGQRRCNELVDIKERLYLQALKDVLVSRDKITILSTPANGEHDMVINRVAIELLDVNQKKRFPPEFFDKLDHNYTISQLSPDTWYILTIKNIIERPVSYLFEQKRLLKTADVNQTDEQALGETQGTVTKENQRADVVSKYRLLELTAFPSGSQIITEATSLHADMFDLKLTIKGPCSLKGAKISLTKEQPSWKARLEFKDQQDDEGDAGVTEPTNRDDIEADVGNNETTVSSQIATTAAVISKATQCEVLCWDYEVVLRDVQQSFPMGEECFPVYRLVGNEKQKPQRDATAQLITSYYLQYLITLFCYLYSSDFAYRLYDSFSFGML